MTILNTRVKIAPRLIFRFLAAALFMAVCGSSSAQFSYDQVEDNTGYEFEEKFNIYPDARYNRVEGLFARGVASFRPDDIDNLLLYGNLGWGQWNESGEQLRYKFGIQKDLFEFNRLTLGAAVYKKLASADDWTVGGVENSVASLLFAGDYKDYYGATGFNFFLDHHFLGLHTLRFEVGRQSYQPLKRNVSWSLLNKSFDENPKRADAAIEPGHEVGVKLVAAFDWRDNPVFPISGWFLEGIFEHTMEDFDTDGLFVTVTRYQPTIGNHRLVIHALAGTRTGSLAEQHLTDLGGVGTLRGYSDKEFTGNRVFMMRANYLFGGDVLQKLPLQELPAVGAVWASLSSGLFFDTGWARKVDIDTGLLGGFGDLSVGNLKSNVGLSILFLEGLLRFDIAKRLDRSRDDFRLTFRINDTF